MRTDSRRFWFAAALLVLLPFSARPASCSDMAIQQNGGSMQSDTAPKRPAVVRLAQGVTERNLIKQVKPKYPPQAKREHVQGVVVLQVRIGEKGDVERFAAISGDPLLVPAAIDAVKRWKCKPFFYQGQPIAVETPITVKFKLR